MPADNTRTIPPRKAHKKATEEELKDVDLRRLRGEISCAECRRLKLKCDRKVPCDSCVRRGCESICPCGILSAGQGTRFILADTQQLHKKIRDMSNRIRQLEDALAIIQATVSTQPHPLLSDDFLRVKFGAESLSPSQSDGNEEEDGIKATIDALGTLTLGESGESKYFGRSAGSESLMMVSETIEAESGGETEDIQFPLAPDLERLSNLFPFTRVGMPNSETQRLLESFLPTKNRAWVLCESYCDHAAYFHRPIKREELRNDLLPRLYANRESCGDCTSQSDGNRGKGVRPHELAVAFFVFAVGALFDLDLPAFNAEADHFHDLGRAALSLQAVYESTSISTIQAMGLMSLYHTCAEGKCSRHSAGSLLSFAAKLAQSIGLHRDSARWHMDPTTVQRRRNLFWETFVADVTHSLALGRPPTIHLSYVDCEFPIDEEATLNEVGEIENGFWRSRHIFARDIFNAIAEATLTAKPPSYKVVLDLDRRIREISFSGSLKAYVTREVGGAEFHSSSLSLRAFYASQHRTVNMLYLHRGFFAQAMLDYPANPLLSPFAPSFLTAYRCASVIIRASSHQFERCAAMAKRTWVHLVHTFSAAVIVGTVVARSPNSTVATSALLDLEVAVGLFERSAKESHRAKVALGVLRKLNERAIKSYNHACSSTLPAQPNTGGIIPSMAIDPQMTSIFSAQSDIDAEDELAIFGGQTRVFTRKTRPKSASSVTSLSTPEDSFPPLESFDNHPVPLTDPFNFLSMPDVHPSLIEYLKHDSVQKSHKPAHLHPSLHSTNAPPSTTAESQNGSRGKSASGSPSSKEMGEIYHSFVEYLASRSISGTPSAPGAIPPSMQHYQPPTQGNSHGSTHRNAPASSANNGWEQPNELHGQQTYQHHASLGSSTSIPAANANTLGDWTFHPVSGNPELAPMAPNQYSHDLNASISPPDAMDISAMMMSGQRGVGGTTYDSRLDPTLYQGYGVEVYPGNNLSASGTTALALSQNSVDSIVEMGLTTESSMDEGWVSFMRECGIMENGRTHV